MGGEESHVLVTLRLPLKGKSNNLGLGSFHPKLGERLFPEGNPPCIPLEGPGKVCVTSKGGGKSLFAELLP